MEVSCAAHETSTLYPRNLKYAQKVVFTRNIQPKKIHVFHIFMAPKFASSKLKKAVESSFARNVFQVEDRHENIQTFLGVVT